MPRKKLKIKPKNLAVTSRGVVIEGEAAADLATFLIQGNTQFMEIAQRLDEKIKPKDLYVDSSGRVVIQSARVQRLAFEAVRFGANPGNPRGLGRLVARTGGRIGTLLDDVPNDRKSPLKGERPDNDLDFFCPSRDGDGVNIVCAEIDDLNDDWDIDCFCGWS